MLNLNNRSFLVGGSNTLMLSPKKIKILDEYQQTNDSLELINNEDENMLQKFL